jgi:hypothetical protein
MSAFRSVFASVDELKRRISITNTEDDELFLDLLEECSALIETVAGRPLRRQHRRIELHRGGSPILILGMTHVAKVHSVRESDVRDFTDPDNYEELVEGSDYVLEVLGTGEVPGTCGFLRRLGSNWLGNISNPSMVQVIYTAGFKTAQEEELENNSVTIQSIATVRDFAAEQFYVDGEVAGVRMTNPLDADIPFYLPETVNPTTGKRAILRFSTNGIILPSWEINGADLAYSVKAAVAGSVTYDLHLLDYDPNSRGISDLYNDVVQGTLLDTEGTSSETYVAKTCSLIASDAIRDKIESCATLGFIAVGFAPLTFLSGVKTTHLGAIQAAAANQPSLAITHRTIIQPNLFLVPNELRNACLVQTVHEYQTRRSPGFTSQAVRGVAVASGSSYMKRMAQLLPQVECVARRYARLM